MNELLLGIDIGTSACKLALFSPDGEVIAQQSEAYPVDHPAPGWAEQDVDRWWGAVCSACTRLFEANSIDPARVAGVGVDGQSWSAIPIDDAGNALCATPIWMDTRATELVDEIRKTQGEERYFALCGNPLSPTYSWPKILWYKRHRPDLYRKTRFILQSNSFIVYRLTGEVTQDLSQGYGLACFDMRRGRWDENAAKDLGLDAKMLPPLYASHQVVGHVTDRAAARTGLLAGTPVVAGGLDAACGTLGVGVLNAGEAQEQGGQAGGMSLCLDRYAADPRLILSFHVAPGRWLLQGGTVGGGGVIRWFEQEFGAAERALAQANNTGVYDEMSAAAMAIPAGSEGLLFLPYMAGERSPLWNARAKGVYFGVDYAKTRAHFIRASMEGVAYSLKHNLDVAEAAGAKADTLRAMGGAANSAVWTQLKADITGRRIVVPGSDTATTLGAAMLAGVGTKVYRGFDEAIARTIRLKTEYVPNPDHRVLYQSGYNTYRELYERLADLMV